MKRPPVAYLATMSAILLVATLSALVSFGIPPFDSLQVFLLGQVASLFTLLVLGVFGGAAVGMLLAHRILANRDFTPFERSVMESLADIQERLEKVEARIAEQERGAAEKPASEKVRR